MSYTPLGPSKQTLLLDDAIYPLLLAGRLTATIRIGPRAVELGPLVFHATEGNYLPINVLVMGIEEMKLGEVTNHQAQMAGQMNVDALFQSLRYFYPSIQPTTTVTFIEFLKQ